MELRRNIYEKLLTWTEANTGRVLELQGARQVGKTYILKKEPGKPTDENPVRKELELYDPTFEDNKETVVIIDEIQEFAKTGLSVYFERRD